MTGHPVSVVCCASPTIWLHLPSSSTGSDQRSAPPVAPHVIDAHRVLYNHVGAGQKYIFTIDEGATGEDGRISVNYDGFINDVR